LSKCVVPDEISSSLITVYQRCLAPYKPHFNINLLNGKFATLWRQADFMPIFKIANSAVVINYKPIKHLKNFCNIFKSIINYQLCSCFKFKLHPPQHGFIKTKSIATNFLNYLLKLCHSFCQFVRADRLYLVWPHSSLW
jgi:hypothetical protein